MDLPRLVSIQVGLPREHRADRPDDARGEQWVSGIFKLPVAGRVRVGRLAVEGDGQADLDNHGGPDRPILAYSAEHYERWRAELDMADVPFGAFGENFTIAGLDESSVCIGDRYAVGAIRVEVSQPRQPCWKLARRWRNKDLPGLVVRHNRGGWYLRVLQEGTVEAGERVELLDRPYPRWTIAEANRLMYHGKDDPAGCAALADCPALSADWRIYMAKRANP